MNYLRSGALALVALLLTASIQARAQDAAFDANKEMGIEQRLNVQVPPDISFFDEYGKPVQLGQYFGKRPIILMLIFYRCYGVCAAELNSVTKSMRAVKSMSIGKDFDILCVSIHPKETPELALEKKQEYLKLYDRPEAEKGWHFLTGRYEDILKLCGVVGYRYFYDPVKNIIRHPAGIMILTPDGRTSKYFYGVDFPSLPLTTALRDAAASMIGTKVRPQLLGCILVDPATGRVSVNIMRTIQVASALVLALLVSYVGWSVVREKRKAGKLGTAGPSA